MKVSPLIETFSARILKIYASVCGQVLAHAHAKAGDAPTIAGYLGNGGHMPSSLAAYALKYADQVERDYALFKRAVRDGRFPLETSQR